MSDEVTIVPWDGDKENIVMLITQDGTRILLQKDYVDAYQGPKSDLVHLLNARALSNYHEHPDPDFFPPTSPLEKASMAVARRAAADYQAKLEKTASARAAARQPRPGRRHRLRDRALQLAAKFMAKQPKATENRVAQHICEELAGVEEHPPSLVSVRRWLKEDKIEIQRLLNASQS